jgi:methyl-accepting chemotaxis protein
MEFGPDTWWLATILLSAVIAVVGYVIKQSISSYLEQQKDLLQKIEHHEKDINEIKRTYVNKQELADVKNDFVKQTDKLQSDVEEIKGQMLTKVDYYRLQTQTEQKIDKIYDLLIKRGENNGK